MEEQVENANVGTVVARSFVPPETMGVSSTVGRELVAQYSAVEDWKPCSSLADIDWRKANAELQGRTMLGSDIFARWQNSTLDWMRAS